MNNKAYWWLLLEIPLAIVILYPVAIISYLWQNILAGWWYGESLFAKQFKFDYPHKGES